MNNCNEHLCKNGGICRNMNDTYTCECVGEWAGDFVSSLKSIPTADIPRTGERCDRECPANSCHNGGTCSIDQSTNRYACLCAPGYTGPHCLQGSLKHFSVNNSVDNVSEVDECQARPCLHGGSCTDQLNGFECQCVDGWMGETCHRENNKGI